MLRLTSLDFVVKKENVLCMGPPGVGKTHLAIALGVKACMAKYRVLFIRTQRLLENLLIAFKTGILGQTLLSLSRLDVIILDELGCQTIATEQANVLFQLVASRYEKGANVSNESKTLSPPSNLSWGPRSPRTLVFSCCERFVHVVSTFPLVHHYLAVPVWGFIGAKSMKRRFTEGVVGRHPDENLIFANGMLNCHYLSMRRVG